ncbi:NRDE family protein [Oceanobacillus alkalisoli]|uniref:NRDE family protein n=1 Tax=Oceanobacillus alkalisoli TaxID=2925113 RepID=UPI001EE3D4B1|nr:NRDE family protein [Oceanobacillus alkalisoli]MCG5102074.1 NRDE family protein [Oceanobacillus alkalisoli]
MCLIHFHLGKHPNYKLIVAANRDEFYRRPTERAHYWPDAPFLLAGRDMLQQGTWLGITKEGRFAALTNIRDLTLESEDKKSRGHIVRDFLSSTDSPIYFLERIRNERTAYAGFNILVGDAFGLFHYNNVDDIIMEVPAGTHSLSNATLNTPWPKVVQGKDKLETYLDHNNRVNTDNLFHILENTEEAPDSKLPNTGIEFELERKLSASFIKTPDYGTRSATVVVIDKNHNVVFKERTYTNGELTSEEKFTFRLPISAK